MTEEINRLIVVPVGSFPSVLPLSYCHHRSGFTRGKQWDSHTRGNQLGSTGNKLTILKNKLLSGKHCLNGFPAAVSGQLSPRSLTLFVVLISQRLKTALLFRSLNSERTTPPSLPLAASLSPQRPGGPAWPAWLQGGWWRRRNSGEVSLSCRASGQQHLLQDTQEEWRRNETHAYKEGRPVETLRKTNASSPHWVSCRQLTSSWLIRPVLSTLWVVIKQWHV